jgi:hypothetical protein
MVVALGVVGPAGRQLRQFRIQGSGTSDDSRPRFDHRPMLMVTTSDGLMHTVAVRRSVAAKPEIQMLTFRDDRCESADLGTGWLGDQTGRAPLQVRQQHRDLSLVEDGVEEAAEPGEHRIRRAVEIDQLLGPFEAARTCHDAARLCSHLQVDHRVTITDLTTTRSTAATTPSEDYATTLIEMGWPMSLVQDQPGHTHVATTAVYTALSDDFKDRVLYKSLGMEWDDDVAGTGVAL